MYLYKISDKLYRLKCDNNFVKDIWLGSKGQIVKPIHDCDILTEEELDFVMSELINE